MTDEPATLADRQYRYDRFTTILLLRDMRFRKGAAGPGDLVPTFKLVTTDGEELTDQDVFGNRPVLLLFGSITCPMTASAMPFLTQLHSEYGDRVDFIMLNVREAHPGEHFRPPVTVAEKLDHARALKQLYGISWTVATDNIEGSLHRALDPKPNSAFLVDTAGVIVFRSLWASDQKAVREALESVAAGRTPDKTQSQALFLPVARAMGQVQEVMDRAGPQAVRDLWRAGLPMALAGRVATIFSPFSRDQRGVAAVLTLALGTLLVLGMITAWLFG
ncbi:MAG: redoxin family protein [Gammaproteobacteria bacterium]|nr:redoxin family protein [Gammaproteobacteria bacterium]